MGKYTNFLPQMRKKYTKSAENGRDSLDQGAVVGIMWVSKKRKVLRFCNTLKRRKIR